jgi:3-hydroxyisobutyrate dehydrogenase-like beta-hydroxyacid dehydrogenase
MASTDQRLRIALLSPGAMGSAVAARLSDAGHQIFTSLDGRSAASRTRAEAAGMNHAPDEALAGCDMILSILPPGDASALVERFAPWLERATTKPLFIDANALNPTSKKALAARLAELGCAMIDGAIIGPPPTKGAHAATTLFLSGPVASRAACLDVPGLTATVMSGEVGAASTLKMCYSGINKGIVGLATALLLAADRHGAADALRAEMQRSMPDLFKRFGRQVPDMFPKAYRWVAEMEEIADFLGEADTAGDSLFRGMAGEFAGIASDMDGEKSAIAILQRAVMPD